MGLESKAGVRHGWGSGAAFCLCEEFDLRPEGKRDTGRSHYGLLAVDRSLWSHGGDRS